ncbi:initiator Replication domain protein, partial [Salmonella enterica]|nr:initiator Replication domain protein [Salmonella enterica]
FDFSLNEDISLSDDEAKFLEEFDKKVL